MRDIFLVQIRSLLRNFSIFSSGLTVSFIFFQNADYFQKSKIICACIVLLSQAKWFHIFELINRCGQPCTSDACSHVTSWEDYTLIYGTYSLVSVQMFCPFIQNKELCIYLNETFCSMSTKKMFHQLQLEIQLTHY
jgi:hypothetical protein